MFPWTPIKRLLFVKDLSKVKSNTVELSIHGDVLNIKSLEYLSKLKKLKLYTVTQAQFDAIIPLVSNIVELRVYDMRCHDLSALGRLTQLENLELDWNTKTEVLWNMKFNTNLRTLKINDFSKLGDISALENLQHVEHLVLTGGIWNKLNLNSLVPLQKLSKLRTLELANLSVADPSQLQPLATLTQLEELHISNQFSTEEYARLSVLLPNTICDYFQPYIKTRHALEGKDIIVTGSRKPWLNSKKDSIQVEKYTRNFHALQEKYRID
jgi:hypothetical protein